MTADSISGDTIPLTDSTGATWDVVGGVVYRNGVKAGFSANVVTVLYFNHVVYQQNNQGLWWAWVNGDWVSTPQDPRTVATQPAPVPTPTPTPVPTPTPTPTPAPSPSPSAAEVSVKGNLLVDASGNPFAWYGPSISGLETGIESRWAAIFGLGQAFWSAYKEKWGITAVRAPINSDSLLGLSNPATASPYQAGLKQMASDVTGAGLAFDIDMHWDAPKTSTGMYQAPTGQGALPTTNALDAWIWIAETFKGNGLVTFELFNEPFGSNQYGNWVGSNGKPGSDAELLLNGGQIAPFLSQNNSAGNALESLNQGSPVTVVGFQAILNAIRSAGAINVCLASPIGWAGEIETWLATAPTDSAGQLGCSWHVYGYNKGSAASLAVAAKAPLVITETYGLDANLNGNGGSNAGYAVCRANHIGYMPWGVLNNWGSVASGATLASQLIGQAPYGSHPAPQ